MSEQEGHSGVRSKNEGGGQEGEGCVRHSGLHPVVRYGPL